MALAKLAAPPALRPVAGGRRAVVQRSGYVRVEEERATVLTSQRKATITNLGLGVRVNQGAELGRGNVYVLNCFPSGSSDSTWEEHFRRTMSAIADAAKLHDPTRERRILLLDHCEESVFWGEFLGRGTVNVTNQVLAETGLYGGDSADGIQGWVLRQIDARVSRVPVVLAVADDPEPPQPGCWTAFTDWLSGCWSSCRSSCSSSNEPDLT